MILLFAAQPPHSNDVTYDRPQPSVFPFNNILKRKTPIVGKATAPKERVLRQTFHNGTPLPLPLALALPLPLLLDFQRVAVS